MHDLPTLTGLIFIPSSMCAVSGLSHILWDRTSDSQRVLTKVVRPVPDAPELIGLSVPSGTIIKGQVKHTNNHNRKLNTLDLVSSPSCDRHIESIYV